VSVSTPDLQSAPVHGPVERVRSDHGLGRYCPKIVYVLSGGAASGLCHLGMIEALENRGISPDLVVGTSAGSLFGALYSHFGNIKDVFSQVTAVVASDEFKEFERKYFRERMPADGHAHSPARYFLSALAGTLRDGIRLGKAVVTSSMIAEKDSLSIFGRILRGISFQTLKVPFAAVAVDLAEGVPVILTATRAAGDPPTVRGVPGPDGLLKAVMASCAIPLIFPAVDIGGHAHADGSGMSILPVREARALVAGQEAFFVGFDVSAPAQLSEEDHSAVELTLRRLRRLMRSRRGADKELIDILFQPVDRHRHWSSFGRYMEFLEIGRRYMTEQRLAAFEAGYLAQCEANLRKDRNAPRRFLSAARFQRFSNAG
jgi:NTE family protein